MLSVQLKKQLPLLSQKKPLNDPAGFRKRI